MQPAEYTDHDNTDGGGAAMGAFGIDVSRFQGNIDWGEVKRSGVEFAMLRAGFGTGSIDVQFRKNAEGCTRCGIPFGVYWFSYAYTPQMAADEAQQCFETVEEYDLAYPVCIDFEEDSVRYAATKGVTVTRELATRIVEDFCGRIEDLGYFAMYYSNLDFLERMFDDRLKSRYALWFARYAKEPGISGAAIWQYSQRGRVNGIAGDVDLNTAMYDIAEVIRRKGLNRPR